VKHWLLLHLILHEIAQSMPYSYLSQQSFTKVGVISIRMLKISIQPKNGIHGRSVPALTGADG
jgi:hypothetical protein